MESDNGPATAQAVEFNPVAELPKPGPLLAVNSTLVIAGSMVLLSCGIRGLTVDDPMAVIFGVIVCPSALTVIILEYAASFRHSEIAAKRLRRIHTFGFVACLMGSTCLTAHILTNERELRDIGPLIGVLLCMAFFAATSELGYRQWLEKLDIWRIRHPEECPIQKRQPFQFTISELLLLMTAVALVAGLTSWMIRMNS